MTVTTWRPGIVYFVLFMAITLADMWSTNSVVSTGTARELNSALADESGGLSFLFLGLNVVLGLIGAVIFDRGVARMADLPPGSVRRSFAILVLGRGDDPVSIGYRQTYYVLVVLIMKSTAVVSNLAIPLGFKSLPRLIHDATGGGLPDGLLLAVTILISIPIGMAIMFPVARWLAVRTMRA